MPTRPLLIAIIVQNMSKEEQGDAEGVRFKAISVMGQEEARKLVYSLGLKGDSPRRVVRQEHLIIRNGVLTKLDESQLGLFASSTKITDRFTLTFPKDDQNTSIKNIQAHPAQIQQESHEAQVKIQKQLDSSLIQEFQDAHIDLDEDYCRINYEKMAIERQIGFLIQQNMIKDEILNGLRQRLHHRINLPIIEQQWRQDNPRPIPPNHPFLFHMQQAPHQMKRQVHRGGIQFNYNSTPRQGIF